MRLSTSMTPEQLADTESCIRWARNQQGGITPQQETAIVKALEEFHAHHTRLGHQMFYGKNGFIGYRIGKG